MPPSKPRATQPKNPRGKSFQIAPPEPIGAGLRRIVEAQLAQAIHRAALGGRHSIAQRVHEARTACQKIRAAMRLLRTHDRGEYGQRESALRASAHGLAPLRDAHILLHSFDRLAEGGGGSISAGGLRQVRRALVAHQRRNSRLAAPALALFARQMRAEKARLARSPAPAGDWDLIEADLLRAYRRARRVYRQAGGSEDSDSALFHRWRKAVKVLGYHHRLLQAGWPPLMDALRRRHDKLSDWLGDEHDLALLREYLAGADSAKIPRATVTALSARVDARRRELRTAALLEGARLFDQKPRVWLRRLESWWTLARSAKPI